MLHFTYIAFVIREDGPHHQSACMAAVVER